MVAWTSPLIWWVALASTYITFTSQSTAEALRLGKPGPSAGLSSSAAHRFPEDLLAQPAYKVVFDSRTISNASAQILLSRGRNSNYTTDTPDIHAITSPALLPPADAPPHTSSQRILMHSSPTSAHLCSLTQPSNNITQSSRLLLSPGNLLAQRHRVINSGLALLAPLHGTCLYYTLDWFTYSLCFGESIRQFRAVANTLGPGRTPVPDPTQDAYVLGRWSDSLRVVGGEVSSSYALPRSHEHPSDVVAAATGEGGQEEGEPDDNEIQKIASLLGITREEALSTDLSPTADHRLSDLLDSYDSQSGTELMQIIRFSTSPSSPDMEQRYLSQVWSDGTRCDINDEPRSVEVQYHCEPGLASSRVALIKETTTCNYVLIVETPLTCKEEQLRVGREKGIESARMGEWRCRRVVDNARTTHQETEEEDGRVISQRQDKKEEAHSSPAIDREPELVARTPLSGQHYAAGVDELSNNIVVEGVEDWTAHLLGRVREGAVTGGLRGRAGGDLDQEAALELGENLEVIFAENRGDAHGEEGLLQLNLEDLFGLTGEPIELRLDAEDLEILAGRRRESAGAAADATGRGALDEQGPLGLSAEDLQGVIARALEIELNKIKAFKERGVTRSEEDGLNEEKGGEEEGSQARTHGASEQERALHARLRRITEALLSTRPVVSGGKDRAGRQDGDNDNDDESISSQVSEQLTGGTGAHTGQGRDGKGKDTKEGESRREELVQRIAEQRAAKVREAQRSAEASIDRRREGGSSGPEVRSDGIHDGTGEDQKVARKDQETIRPTSPETRRVREAASDRRGRESFAERAEQFFRKQEEREQRGDAKIGDSTLVKEDGVMNVDGDGDGDRKASRGDGRRDEL